MPRIPGQMVRPMTDPDDPYFFVPPGHFYSPIPDPAEARSHLEKTWGSEKPLRGISIDDAALKKCWKTICKHQQDMNFPEEREPEYRYFYNNDQFSYGDAVTYTSFLRELNSARVMEIGSGFSSALALDLRRELELDVNLTFIEPYPERLNALLRDEDKSSIALIEDKVQNVQISEFEALQPNDILIIDSSHVGKTGSDVCYELFEILPSLKAGVNVMIHDIFYPFEYPKAWTLDDQRAWNETYLVRAFLMYNQAFEINFFNHYFALKFPQLVRDTDIRFLTSPGGSLWLKARGE